MTEEEKKEYYRKRYQEKKEDIKKHQREYYQQHKEEKKQKVAEYQKSHPEGRRERSKRFYERHREEILSQRKEPEIKDQIKEYRNNNREKYILYQREYYASKRGRANNILGRYKISDKNKGLLCTITPEFIETEIFTKSCVYCGESDWKKLGCDRIDNNKGHTPDNVVCSCGECNNDRNRRKMSVDEYKKYKKMGSY